MKTAAADVEPRMEEADWVGLCPRGTAKAAPLFVHALWETYIERHPELRGPALQARREAAPPAFRNPQVKAGSKRIDG